MIKTYYYAINKDGQGWYYDSPPIFDGESWNVDPTYDCLECMGAVNDLHPANLFSFPIGHTLELDMGPSCPNPGIRRQLDAKGEPYMCTSDLTTWIGIDGDWYRTYKPSITLEWPDILELAETEEELLDYLEDVSEFTRNEKGNN